MAPPLIGRFPEQSLAIRWVLCRRVLLVVSRLKLATCFHKVFPLGHCLATLTLTRFLHMFPRPKDTTLREDLHPRLILHDSARLWCVMTNVARLLTMQTHLLFRVRVAFSVGGIRRMYHRVRLRILSRLGTLEGAMEMGFTAIRFPPQLWILPPPFRPMHNRFRSLIGFKLGPDIMATISTRL